MMERKKIMIIGIVEIVLLMVLAFWQGYIVSLSVLGFANSILLFYVCCKSGNDGKQSRKETRKQKKEEKKFRKLEKKAKQEENQRRISILKEGANGDW